MKLHSRDNLQVYVALIVTYLVVRGYYTMTADHLPKAPQFVVVILLSVGTWAVCAWVLFTEDRTPSV